MKSSTKTIAAVTLGIPAVLAVGVLWLIGGWPDNDKMTFPPVFENPDGANAPTGHVDHITVFSYNMHFGVGRDDDHTKQSRESILERLDDISELINSLGVDVILLQEVDYDSDRTYNIDQLNHIADKTGLKYIAPVVTWKKGFIPYPWPPSKMYGKMLSGQAVLSRFPIVGHIATKQDKPESNPFWYNAFYLQRTLQHVTIEVNSKRLDFLNVHTEAFDLANRQKHAEQICSYVERNRSLKIGNSYNALIMAGDFNAVPPEASVKKNFVDEPDNDMTDDKSVEQIRKLKFTEMLDSEKDTIKEQDTFTFPSDAPSRRLDYFYISPELSFIEGRIVKEAETLSDHLPLVAKLKLSQ